MNLRQPCIAFLLMVVSVLATSSVALAEDSCDKLMGLTVSGAKIIFAQTVAAGTFAGPPSAFTGRDLTAFYKHVPAFCRVVTIAIPTTDSEIRVEVWMPSSGWNGKLQGIGNGGFAGVIDYMQLGVVVTKGYAATATDTGHGGTPVDAGWALGHSEKVIDFGHRGIHEMTRVAKELLRAFYGKNVQHAYLPAAPTVAARR